MARPKSIPLSGRKRVQFVRHPSYYEVDLVDLRDSSPAGRKFSHALERTLRNFEASGFADDFLENDCHFLPEEEPMFVVVTMRITIDSESITFYVICTPKAHPVHPTEALVVLHVTRELNQEAFDESLRRWMSVYG